MKSVETHTLLFGCPKATKVWDFAGKERKKGRKEGRKKERKERRKEEKGGRRRREGGRKEGRKERREGRKEGRKAILDYMLLCQHLERGGKERQGTELQVQKITLGHPHAQGDSTGL
jgi:hypothetical protein